MKKILAFFTAIVFLTSFVVAQEACDLTVTLLNQDPYPAVQGDLAKLVFQVEGIESTNCQNLKIELIEKYPFTLDPGSEKSHQITSGTFSKDFSSTFLAPFKVRVDENALDGENPIEVKYTYGTTSTGVQTKSFNIEVQDVRADFEIFVKNYNSLTKEITFEILNVGEADIEALTVEIPEQEGVTLIGADKNIVGDLDSNEDTSADFKISTKNQEIILNMIYSDVNNERRAIQKTVVFNHENFKTEKQGRSKWTWFFLIVIIGGISYWYYKKRKKKHHAVHHKEH